MEENKRIDYSKIFTEIGKRKKLFFKTLPVAFVLSCIWILPQPRYYTSEVMLAPEGMDEVDAGSLSSLASSFGLNIGGAVNDAIYPMLYPDLFESPHFIVDLLKIKVEYTREGEQTVNTDYYTYLKDYQEKNWLTQPFINAGRSIKKLFSKKAEARCENATQLDAFHLSYDDYKLLELVPKAISCSVDKKTNVTTITVTDQDNLISAQLADSVRLHLQHFITDLRTAKSQHDVAYYQHLVDSVKTEYDESVKAYAKYTDSHKDIILQAYISERDELENKMSTNYETYNTMLAQLTAAKAKLQEKTPVFTVLKSATVPAKPAGPKRMLFVGFMLVLTFIGTSIYILRDIIKKAI